MRDREVIEKAISIRRMCEDLFETWMVPPDPENRDIECKGYILDFLLIFCKNVFKMLFWKITKKTGFCWISWKMCVKRWGCITLLLEVCLTQVYLRTLDACNTPAERKPSHNTFKCSGVKEKKVPERSPLTLWIGQNNYQKLRNFVHWGNLYAQTPFLSS